MRQTSLRHPVHAFVMPAWLALAAAAMLVACEAGGQGASTAADAAPAGAQDQASVAEPAAGQPSAGNANPDRATASAPAAVSPAGVYALASPLASELRVVPLPGRPGEYRVEVHGGGDPRDGAGVAADCQAVAEGRLQGDRIDAALVPFASDIGGLDATDLEAAPRLQLTLHGDSAQLQGDFGHCPMGTAMSGAYRRTQAPRLMVDCPPLPAACWNRD